MSKANEFFSSSRHSVILHTKLFRPLKENKVGLYPHPLLCPPSIWVTHSNSRNFQILFYAINNFSLVPPSLIIFPVSLPLLFSHYSVSSFLYFVRLFVCCLASFHLSVCLFSSQYHLCLPFIHLSNQSLNYLPVFFSISVSFLSSFFLTFSLFFFFFFLSLFFFKSWFKKVEWMVVVAWLFSPKMRCQLFNSVFSALSSVSRSNFRNLKLIEKVRWSFSYFYENFFPLFCLNI